MLRVMLTPALSVEATHNAHGAATRPVCGWCWSDCNGSTTTMEVHGVPSGTLCVTGQMLCACTRLCDTGGGLCYDMACHPMTKHWQQMVLWRVCPRADAKRTGFRTRGVASAPLAVGSNLVDPASSYMLVSKIKPCMSKHKCVYSEAAGAHYISYRLFDGLYQGYLW